MNRRELVQAVAAHSGVDGKQVDQVLRGFTDVVTAVVSKGEPVGISGFAKFSKVERAARTGRNPQTGETIKIKASKKARITPLKAFKDAVLGDFDAVRNRLHAVATEHLGSRRLLAVTDLRAPALLATYDATAAPFYVRRDEHKGIFGRLFGG